MGYTRFGPFTDGSASPPINGAFLTAIDLAVAQSAAYAAPLPSGGDDTAALQAFLTSNAGKTILIPPLTYQTTGLTVPAGTRLNGVGAKIVALSGTNDTVTLNDQCQVIGVEIDATAGTSSSTCVRTVQNVQRVAVRNCYLHGAQQNQVFYDHAYHSSITDNVINSPGTNPPNSVYVAFSDNVTITGNFAVGGFEVWGGDASVAGFTPGCARIWANNNHVETGGIFLDGIQDFTLNDNYSYYSVDVGMDVEGCTNGTIVGNTVHNANNYGISLFYGCSDVTVTGNSVVTDDATLTGQKVGIGILTSKTSTRLVIDGNRVRVPAHGIYTDNTALLDSVIVGNYLQGSYGILLQSLTNVVVNANRLTVTGTRGIGIEGSTQVSIIGNRVHQVGGDSSSAGANGGVWMYDRGSPYTASNNIVKDNKVIGFATSISAYGNNNLVGQNVVDAGIYSNSSRNNSFTDNRSEAAIGTVVAPTYV